VSVKVSTNKSGIEGVHGVRCKTWKLSYYNTNVMHCITTKDAVVTISFGTEEMH
jgi:hypothetical protein